MATKASRKPISYDCPATYRIIVQGRVDPTWSDRLEGMIIYPATAEDSSPVTTLVGRLSDKAGLDGLVEVGVARGRLIITNPESRAGDPGG